MTNYHTHTYRCKHASGDVADYVDAAAAAGLAELGISDHCPHPDGRWPTVRMGMDELPGYLAAIEAARGRGGAPAEGAAGPPRRWPEPPQDGHARQPSPGAPQPRLLAGLECEWGPDIEPYLRDEYLGAFGLDYLALGVHNYLHRGQWRDAFYLETASELKSFADTTCRAMESGLFAFVAHPDVFCYSWLAWDKNARDCATDILQTAQATGTPLEINGYGFRKPKVGGWGAGAPRRPYPRDEFWEMAAEYDIACLANSDAHRPSDIAAGIAEASELAARYGLTLLQGIRTAKDR